MTQTGPTIPEMIEALCLYDEPMLNSRYHGWLLQRRTGDGEDLAQLPQLALKAERLAHAGAAAWEEVPAHLRKSEFVEWAEHTLLLSFLTLCENQLRIVSHIARAAPTKASRGPFDEMAATHREIATLLRNALKESPSGEQVGAAYRRSVQEERANGDFRGQLEEAIQAAERSASGVREIVLSPTGLRHLRDEGCFHDDARLRGHAVSVDLGWEAPAFVIETFDRVTLDEIVLQNGRPSTQATDAKR